MFPSLKMSSVRSPPRQKGYVLNQPPDSAPRQKDDEFPGRLTTGSPPGVRSFVPHCSDRFSSSPAPRGLARTDYPPTHVRVTQHGKQQNVLQALEWMKMKLSMHSQLLHPHSTKKKKGFPTSLPLFGPPGQRQPPITAYLEPLSPTACSVTCMGFETNTRLGTHEMEVKQKAWKRLR